MRIRNLIIPLVIWALAAIYGCATVPLPENMRLVPLAEANMEAVFEENEGLEVSWENAKEVRDFYRGGVQQKFKAERKFQGKEYPVALKIFLSSNDFFSALLKYIDEDSADYTLFEGTNVLFFPNLLLADNNLKMGRIHEAMGRQGAAHRHWKRALSSVKRSLKSERTEWGLALQDEISLLLTPKKD
jgi:hypothetical protein